MNDLTSAIYKLAPALRGGWHLSAFDRLAGLAVRLRFQVLGGLLVGVLVPALVRQGGDWEGLTTAGQVNTLAGSASALVVGLWFLRRLSVFPGARASAYIVPVFAATFALVLAAFLFLRLEYNRFQFPASFVVAVAWFYSLYFLSQRMRTLRLAVVPGGDTSRLLDIPRVRWQPLARPQFEPRLWDGVVADLRAEPGPEWERFIADAAVAGTPVYHTKQVSESLTGRVEIEHLSENTLGSINPNLAYAKLKQLGDWLTALAALVLLAPMMLAIAAAVRLESPGPALFRQTRTGFRGRPFTMLKFRTMLTRPRTAPARDDAITRDGDERITGLGRVLRRTRLDELPQLINILRGEMSWIGPRPEAAVLSEWYERELPFYRYRHVVRPGITGWAQINQGHVAELPEVLGKLHFDFYYIKNFSPWLDILILIRTVRTVLTGLGAR